MIALHFELQYIRLLPGSGVFARDYEWKGKSCTKIRDKNDFVLAQEIEITENFKCVVAVFDT